MRNPLLLPLLYVASGILAGRWLGILPRDAAWPAAAFLLLALGARRSPRLLKICAALAMVFAGMFIEAWHRPDTPPRIFAGPDADVGSKETVILAGCVVEPTVFSPNREQFTLELDADLKARARVSLPIESDAPPQRLDYGQRVEIEARVRRPRNFNNPGSFDYAAWLAHQNIYWTASMTRGSRARLLPGRCGSRFFAAIFALRVAALRRIENLYGSDEYSTGMLEAVLIGETSKLEKIWTQDFRRTGTFHALVISGVHVTVLAGVLLFFLRVCGVPEMSALAIAAVGAWLYALVSGMSAPVVRAAGGFTLYLLARFFFRRGRVLNLLAAVALVYVIWDPAQMFDASFQLSFLCVAAIGALATPIIDLTSAPYQRATRLLDRIDDDPLLAPRLAQFRVELRLLADTIELWTPLPRAWAAGAAVVGPRLAIFAFDMALISTMVQIGLALPMAEYFHRVSFSGLTANLLIVPLLNCVVPLGFISIFSGWHWSAALAAWMLRLSARIAAWHAHIEPDWRIADPPLWLAIACAASLVAVAVAFSRRRLRAPALALAIALFALLVWHPFAPAIAPRTLELTAIDVGQGDSLLLAFPGGKLMMVDGGGVLSFGARPRKPNLDTGEDVVSPYLWSRGIRRIDVLVVTHSHADHAGGAAAILENFRPAELWVGTNPPPALIAQARRFHVAVRELRASPAFAFGGATVQILSPPQGYLPTKSANNDSLAFRIGYGSRHFLLTGDMERPMEARILASLGSGAPGDALASGGDLQADVLKVGHHGSRTSTTQPFLDAVAPSIAVISAGFENSFGHPNRDVLARLVERHAAVLRTDLDGLVTVRTDGRRLTIDTMAWREASPWWTGEQSFNWAAISDK